MTTNSKKILISTRAYTCTKDQNLFCNSGHQFLEFPLIKTVGILPKKKEIDAVDTFNWLIFTSANGVRYFAEIYRKQLPEQIKIAAIGKKTAQILTDLSMPVHFENNSKHSGEFATDLKRLWQNKAVNALWLTSELAGTKLSESLSEVCTITRLNIYKTTLPEQINPSIKERIIKGEYDLIFFYSSSAVRNFVKIFEGQIDYTKVKAACIGEITAQSCSDYSIKPITVASSPSTEVLFNESLSLIANL